MELLRVNFRIVSESAGNDRHGVVGSSVHQGKRGLHDKLAVWDPGIINTAKICHTSPHKPIWERAESVNDFNDDEHRD
jgi:hypothetical protein